MYASLFDLYAVLDALLFQTVGADACILPMGQKTTPSPDQVLVARKLNMGKSFRGELGGPDASPSAWRLCRHAVPAPDMPVPQLRLAGAHRKLLPPYRPPLAFRRGTPMRGNNATGSRNGTGWALYTLSVTVDLHTFYTTQRSKA